MPSKKNKKARGACSTPPYSEESARDFLHAVQWFMNEQATRSEAFTSRSVSLLGLQGVLLAVLAGFVADQAPSLGAHQMTALVSCVLLVCASCTECLVVMSARKVGLPTALTFQENWLADRARIAQVRINGKLAQALCVGTTDAEEAPIITAQAAANARAFHFRMALYLSGASLPPLAGLVISLAAEGR